MSHVNSLNSQIASQVLSNQDGSEELDPNYLLEKPSQSDVDSKPKTGSQQNIMVKTTRLLQSPEETKKDTKNIDQIVLT